MIDKVSAGVRNIQNTGLIKNIYFLLIVEFILHSPGSMWQLYILGTPILSIFLLNHLSSFTLVLIVQHGLATCMITCQSVDGESKALHTPLSFTAFGQNLVKWPYLTARYTLKYILYFRQLCAQLKIGGRLFYRRTESTN